MSLYRLIGAQVLVDEAVNALGHSYEPNLAYLREEIAEMLKSDPRIQIGHEDSAAYLFDLDLVHGARQVGIGRQRSFSQVRIDSLNVASTGQSGVTSHGDQSVEDGMRPRGSARYQADVGAQWRAVGQRFGLVRYAVVGA